MSLKNCLTYLPGEKNIASFRKLLFFGKRGSPGVITSLVVTIEIFSVGQDSSKFVQNTLQRVIFSTRISEMKQHCL